MHTNLTGAVCATRIRLFYRSIAVRFGLFELFRLQCAFAFIAIFGCESHGALIRLAVNQFPFELLAFGDPRAPNNVNRFVSSSIWAEFILQLYNLVVRVRVSRRPVQRPCDAIPLCCIPSNLRVCPIFRGKTQTTNTNCIEQTEADIMEHGRRTWSYSNTIIPPNDARAACDMRHDDSM